MENIKHSGVCHDFESGAKREDKTGKGRCDLLPPRALMRISRHFEAGGKIYGDRNWEKGIPIHSFIDSGIRHLLRYLDGETDEDHLCAAAWNIICALETEEKRPEMQDIPARMAAPEPNTATHKQEFYIDSDGAVTLEGD